MSKIFNKVVMSETAPSVNDLWLNKGKISYFSNGWNTLIDTEGDKNYDIGKGLHLSGNNTLEVKVSPHSFHSDFFWLPEEHPTAHYPIVPKLRIDNVNGIEITTTTYLYDHRYTSNNGYELSDPLPNSRALVTERALKAQLDKVRKEVVPGIALYLADGSKVSVGTVPEDGYYYSSVMGIFEEV